MKAVSHNKEQARAIFNSIDWNAGPLKIIVEPFKAGKSQGQYGLFHIFMREINEHFRSTGVMLSPNKAEAEEKIKELVKSKFCPREIVMDHEVLKSTKRYTWDEMCGVLWQVIAWAATDLGLELKAKSKFERMIAEKQ